MEAMRKEKTCRKECRWREPWGAWMVGIGRKYVLYYSV
jgi:hypothetical protein